VRMGFRLARVGGAGRGGARAGGRARVLWNGSGRLVAGRGRGGGVGRAAG